MKHFGFGVFAGETVRVTSDTLNVSVQVPAQNCLRMFSYIKKNQLNLDGDLIQHIF